jgi:RimJ/RimL family protein N-acetyltransferase
MRRLETGRLVIRRLTPADAPFILELVNDPDWLRFIGDRGIRTLDDARAYIEKGPMEMYARHGIGLCLVELKETGVPVGICGLLHRDYLDDPDIGFAFLPAHRGKGYAYESASAVLEYGLRELELARVVAVTALDNERSGQLLEKLGLRFVRVLRFPNESKDVRLFATATPAAG